MTCETCKGEGVSKHYENQAPLGSGMIWNEEIIDDCPDCTGKGFCPKCDAEWSDSTFEYYLDCIGSYRGDEFICSFCDWRPE